MSKKFAIVEKQFEYKGHDCVVVFNRLGFRCGYVSVTDKKHYDEYDIGCHGGLTYGAEPLPADYGQKRNLYIGFDCGHCGDGHDFKQAKKYGLIDDKEYCTALSSYVYLDGNPVCTLEYVEMECKKIVDQLEDKQ